MHNKNKFTTRIDLKRCYSRMVTLIIYTTYNFHDYCLIKNGKTSKAAS